MILKVFCRRPAENYPDGLTFLVEEPRREEAMTATRVVCQYMDGPEYEANLKTYQDYHGTGVGSTIAHRIKIKRNIIRANNLHEGDSFETEFEIREDGTHFYHIVRRLNN